MPKKTKGKNKLATPHKKASTTMRGGKSRTKSSSIHTATIHEVDVPASDDFTVVKRALAWFAAAVVLDVIALVATWGNWLSGRRLNAQGTSLFDYVTLISFLGISILITLAWRVMLTVKFQCERTIAKNIYYIKQNDLRRLQLLCRAIALLSVVATTSTTFAYFVASGLTNTLAYFLQVQLPGLGQKASELLSTVISALTSLGISTAG
jgi:hypothetical protein